MSEIINTDTAPKPVGAYPHARRVGELLFLSGVGSRTRRRMSAELAAAAAAAATDSSKSLRSSLVFLLWP